MCVLLNVNEWICNKQIINYNCVEIYFTIEILLDNFNISICFDSIKFYLIKPYYVSYGFHIRFFLITLLDNKLEKLMLLSCFLLFSRTKGNKNVLFYLILLLSWTSSKKFQARDSVLKVFLTDKQKFRQTSTFQMWDIDNVF